MENTEITDLQESTLGKIDSEKCKRFYVLTPWLEPPEVSDLLSREEEKKSSSNIDKEKIIIRDSNFISSPIEENSANENSCVTIELTKFIEPEEPILNDEKKLMLQGANSTLANSHESSSICCADEVLSEISDSGENIYSKGIATLEDFVGKTDLEQPSYIEKKNHHRISNVLDNFTKNLPQLDLSPISQNSQNIENNHASTNTVESAIRTDSKHRFRSLSHDSRTASSAEHLDIRRGESVSPPSRNKNKQRSMKKSKIPTLSPGHRTMQLHQETDGSISEAANQIRSALLRKLRQVWEQYPRDAISSSNHSKNSSLESSIYHTPETVSRIPLPRRSPRHRNTNDLSHSPRYDDDHCELTTNQTNQSKDYCIDTTNVPRLSDNVFSPVPLHSTPKSSHPSRRITNRR